MGKISACLAKTLQTYQRQGRKWELISAYLVKTAKVFSFTVLGKNDEHLTAYLAKTTTNIFQGIKRKQQIF